MKIFLFDPLYRNNFFPLTVNKAVAELQTGMFTLKTWWEKISGYTCCVLTPEYLSKKYETYSSAKTFIYINAAFIPSFTLWEMIKTLDKDTVIQSKDEVTIAFKSYEQYNWEHLFSLQKKKIITIDAETITQPFHIFQKNESFILQQFPLVTQNKKSHNSSSAGLCLSPNNIFLEENCNITGAILNAENGPIYISKNAVVMEGSCIRGPFFLGEHSVVKMGAKIYGATSIGKKCTVGGEIKNVIMHDYSNKAHDGYLGDSVIGSWCNMGAGTSCSNVKNTAASIKMYSYAKKDFIKAGLKCGIIMGDYSRTAINLSINSGSSIGICCNLLETKLSEKYYKNFSWYNGEPASYEINKAIEHIHNWMKFKGCTLKKAEEEILRWIYENMTKFM